MTRRELIKNISAKTNISRQSCDKVITALAEEIKDCLAYFRILSNEDDDISFFCEKFRIMSVDVCTDKVSISSHHEVNSEQSLRDMFGLDEIEEQYG